MATSGEDAHINGHVRATVVKFLWDGNVELDAPFVEYLSKLVFEEAVAVPNGSTRTSVANAIRQFVPSLQFEDLESRVEGLVKEVQQFLLDSSDKVQPENRGEQDGFLQAEKKGRIGPADWSPSRLEQSSQQPPSPMLRSEPAAAFLASFQEVANTEISVPTSTFLDRSLSFEGKSSLGPSVGTSGSEPGRGDLAAGSVSSEQDYSSSFDRVVLGSSSQNMGEHENDTRSSGSLSVPAAAPNGTHSADPVGSSSPPPNHSGPSPEPHGVTSSSPPPTSSVRRSLVSQLSFGRLSLNPNAVEFVPGGKSNGLPPHPGTLGSPIGATTGPFSSRSAPSLIEANAMSVLKRSNSTQSNASDDEYRRYWREHLPDELITADDLPATLLPTEEEFDFEEPVYSSRLVRPNVSIGPIPRAPPPGSPRGPWGMAGPPPGSPIVAPPGSPMGRHSMQGLMNTGGAFGYGNRMEASPQASPPRGQVPGYSPPPGAGPRFGAPLLSTSPALRFGRPFGMPPPFELPPGPVGLRERPPPPPWLPDGFEVAPLGGDFHEDLNGEDPVRILAAEFPGFSADSLVEILCANNGDLRLTMEMLTQLELQDGGGPSPRFMRPAPPPSLTSMDFPALSGADMLGALPALQHGNMESAPLGMRRLDESGPLRSGPDFAAVVRKHAARQGHWHFERNDNNMDVGGGRGRAMPPGGAAPFLGETRGGQGDRVEHYGRRPPPWLDTGDPVASMYADMREDARDHARMRNAYFEQATQAYLAGNKALAKELSAKGQWHNDQMKAAHAKAGEAIFRQRNLASGFLGPRGAAASQARVLDLHGLHVSEAITILKRELGALRDVAHHSRQPQQMMVCVGTGHHTKGRGSARLPLAVERYLEEERFKFSETQPGMLRVLV